MTFLRLGFYGQVVEGLEIAKHNVFRAVKQEEILEAEQYLGFPLPSELQAFYEQIGYGYLSTPHNPKPSHHQSGNEILPPHGCAFCERGTGMGRTTALDFGRRCRRAKARGFTVYGR